MKNNDIFKRLRYGLNLDDAAMLEIFRLGEYPMDQTTLAAYLRNEEEAGYLVCGDQAFSQFLDGLIILKRGRRDDAPAKPAKVSGAMDNNTILKKLRIALAFREEDMLATMTQGGLSVSKSELSALFRRPGQPNYQICGDQILRNFLKGLNARSRSDGAPEAKD